MKKYGVAIPFLLLFLFPVIFQHCATHPVDHSGFLPPVKIQLPRNAKNDPDMVSFVLTTENHINSLSNRLETVATRGNMLLRKKDVSFLEKIKLMKIKIQIVNGTNALIGELEKVQQYRRDHPKEVKDRDHVAACESLSRAIKKRLMDLTRKYNELFTL